MADEVYWSEGADNRNTQQDSSSLATGMSSMGMGRANAFYQADSEQKPGANWNESNAPNGHMPDNRGGNGYHGNDDGENRGRGGRYRGNIGGDRGGQYGRGGRGGGGGYNGNRDTREDNGCSHFSTENADSCGQSWGNDGQNYRDNSSSDNRGRGGGFRGTDREQSSRGRGGYHRGGGNSSFGDENGEDLPSGGSGGGFRGRGGGRGGGGYYRGDENGEDNPSGGRGGGFRGRGGGRGGGGYYRGDENGEDNPSGGRGGGFRGRGGGGYYRGDENGQDNPSGGSGEGFRGRGGGRGGGGYYRGDENGEDNPSGGSGGGFRGRGGGRGGSGYYQGDNDGEDDGHRGRGGFRSGRGGSFSGGYDNNGFGGDDGYRGRGGRGGRGGSSYTGDNDNNGYSGGQDDDGNSFGGGGRGRGRGGFSGRGGRGGYDNDGGDGGNGWGGNVEEGKERPPPYTPKEKVDADESNFIPSGINFSKYDDIPVKVSGNNPPKPITSFADSGLREYLLNNVKRAGYEVPTPVQKNAIPMIMTGRDVMSCAQTGSGKTAAFLLPMLHKMLEMAVSVETGSLQKPLGLIVAPTRELADQIDTEARKFARGSGIKICLIYGGTMRGPQFRNVERGVHLLIATPGRLLDFIENGKFSFENLQFLVLDEADRMLDMGFRTDIDRLVNNETMPPVGTRQTLMFSATFPEEIQHMAHNMLNDHLFVSVGIVGGANEDIKQIVLEVSKADKRNTMLGIVDDNEKTMIFVQLKKGADFLASYLSGKNIPTTSIHGDRFQNQREEALHEFRTGKMKCIICTDVASRGLDIKDVTHIINYDMPQCIDDYVHRIGRTGRVGNVGKATSFFDPQYDSGLIAGLVKILSDAHQEVPEFLQSGVGGYGGEEGSGRYGSRDIRPQRDFDNRSNTDHYEVNAPAGGGAEEESWD